MIINGHVSVGYAPAGTNRWLRVGTSYELLPEYRMPFTTVRLDQVAGLYRRYTITFRVLNRGDDEFIVINDGLTEKAAKERGKWLGSVGSRDVNYPRYLCDVDWLYEFAITEMDCKWGAILPWFMVMQLHDRYAIPIPVLTAAADQVTLNHMVEFVDGEVGCLHWVNAGHGIDFSL